MNFPLLRGSVHGQNRLIDARIVVTVLRVANTDTSVNGEVLVRKKGRLALKVIVSVARIHGVLIAANLVVSLLYIEKAILSVLLVHFWALDGKAG